MSTEAPEPPVDRRAPLVAQDAQTLTTVLRELDGEGYTAQFRPLEGGRMRCLTCEREYPGRDAHFDGLRRLEGASDPADMLAVIAVACPHCGARGTLILNYGPETTPEEADLLSALDPSTTGP